MNGRQGDREGTRKERYEGGRDRAEPSFAKGGEVPKGRRGTPRGKQGMTRRYRDVPYLKHCVVCLRKPHGCNLGRPDWNMEGVLDKNAWMQTQALTP